jgi:hypothetical protein
MMFGHLFNRKRDRHCQKSVILDFKLNIGDICHMDNEIQSLLNSPLAEDRKQGLEMLAQSRDSEALKALSAMHKRETDAEIKQMIVQVGKGIKRRIEAQGDSFGATSDVASAVVSSRDNAADWANDMSDYNFDKPKRKNEFQIEETSWGTALMDVGLYGLLSGASVFLLALFLIYALGGVFQEIANSPSMYGKYEMAQLGEYMNSLGFMFALIYGVVVAIISMIFYMIMFGIIHFVSTSLLSGRGSYTGVLHHAFLPMIVWIVVSFVLGAIGFYTALSAFASAETIDQLQTMSNASNLMSVLNLIAAIGFMLWLSAEVGKNYQFGMGKGCASLIISYIAIFAVICGCYFVFFMIIVNNVSSSGFQGFIPLFF